MFVPLSCCWGWLGSGLAPPVESLASSSERPRPRDRPRLTDEELGSLASRWRAGWGCNVEDGCPLGLRG